MIRKAGADTLERPKEDVQVRYIKLGGGGAWAQFALEHGRIPFDCYGVDHAVCQAGDWAGARRQLEADGQRDIGDALRQLKDFYEQPQDTIWFTIANRSLYWATAHETVQHGLKQEPGLPKRWRRAKGGWRNQGLTGEPLSLDNLSPALTKVTAYPKSICGTEEKDYLLRRIRGDDDPLFERAQHHRAESIELALAMIRRLRPDEFELLVDLIFARSGWHRVGQVGGSQADIDLMLEHPMTGEAAWVQIKSACAQADLDRYCQQFASQAIASRCFFTVHSPNGHLRTPDIPNCELWTGPSLADRAVKAGLFDWLMQRVR